MDFRYEDPGLGAKLKAVGAAAAANPGSLPVRINLHYANGAVVAIELDGGVCPTELLLSDLGKIAVQDAWGLDVKPDIFAEPPEKRWPRKG